MSIKDKSITARYSQIRNYIELEASCTSSWARSKVFLCLRNLYQMASWKLKSSSCEEYEERIPQSTVGCIMCHLEPRSDVVPAMLLPVELIDRILSFLRGDGLALNACSISPPTPFPVCWTIFLCGHGHHRDWGRQFLSLFHEIISENPHILDYLRTLEIRTHSHIVSPPLLTQNSKLLTIISMIPRTSSLKLGDTLFGSSLYNGNEFFPTFQTSLQRSSLQHLSLVSFDNLPLFFLDNAKKLTLIYCSGIMDQLLETLIIRSNPDVALLNGMTTGVANLKSLQLRGLLTTKFYWNGFSELLARLFKFFDRVAYLMLATVRNSFIYIFALEINILR